MQVSIANGLAQLLTIGVASDDVKTSSISNNRAHDLRYAYPVWSHVTPNEFGQLPMLFEGRETFRHDTFGDEAFCGDTRRLHEAIAGVSNRSYRREPFATQSHPEQQPPLTGSL